MKRFYLLAAALFLSAAMFAQVPLMWWATLPLDFEENPVEREEVNVLPIDDEFVNQAATLEELWASVGESVKFAIDFNTTTSVNDWSTGEKQKMDVPPQEDEGDYEGHALLMASSDYFYALMNVTDDEVITEGDSKDGFEVAMTPSGEPYDPGRELKPNPVDAPWMWDADSGMYKKGGTYIPVETLHNMAGYGYWGELNSGKLAFNLTSEAELYANFNMYMDDITNRGDTIDITPGTSTTEVPLVTKFESRTGGYLFLAVIPQSLMVGWDMSEAGNHMSIAIQARDYDADNFEYVKDSDGNKARVTYAYWGGADDNLTYAFPTFYGALATVMANTGAQSIVNENINAYFANGHIFFSSDDISQVEVFSVTGAKVLSVDRPSGNIDVSHLVKGVYITRVKENSGASNAFKFVKY